MQRYLMHISYIGTQFRGVQKIFTNNEPYKPDPTTIQGCLEIALQKLKPVNQIHVIPSSRTDSGVHALHSTFHVDLLRFNNQPFAPNTITTVLNKFFFRENLQIRVSQTQQICNSFHCRYNAKSRTYLYRLAILKKEFYSKSNQHLYDIPIEEYSRCYFLCFPDVNIEKMKETTKLLVGYHDFRSFMGRGSHVPKKNTRRTLEILQINEGMPSTYVTNKNIYNYWNIICKSEGFLYNQVRRIVGTLIAAGQGKVTSKDITCMLQIPSHLSWNPRIIPAPSHGLYLYKVEYSPNDLEANIIA